MRSERLVPVVLLFTVLSLAASSEKVRIAEQVLDPGFQPRPFKKLVVVGISDDMQARKNFENQFVSHLRGRGIQGVTSYSIVPDLTAERDEKAIVRAVHDQGIDAAITVRLVPLIKPLTRESWEAAWNAAMEEPGDLRRLIDDSLPVAATKAGRFGVEAALWETDGWHRIWGGRIDPASRKELRKRSGDFVQSVMNALPFRNLL